MPDVSNYLNVVRSEADSLKAHHVTLSWFRLAEIALCLAIIGGMYVHSVRKDAENLGRFQAMFEEYRADSKKAAEDMKASFEQRLKEAETRSKTEVVVANRTKDNDKHKDEVLNNQDKVQAQTDFYGAYKRSVVIVPEGFTMDLDTLKQTIVAKLDAGTLKANFEDTQKNYESAKASLASAEKDLDTQKGLTAQCDASLAQLKKVKTPSKFRKALGDALKFGLGVLVGKGLGAL
jgi:hypothetical protein